MLGVLSADSQKKARRVLDDFRRWVHPLAVQAKVDVAEAAFPPCDRRVLIRTTTHSLVDAAEAAFPPATSAATGRPTRHNGRQADSAVTVCANVRIRRVRWHCSVERSKASMDRLLHEAKQAIREGVRTMLYRVNPCASSFAATVAILKRTADTEVSQETK